MRKTSAAIKGRRTTEALTEGLKRWITAAGLAGMLVLSAFSLEAGALELPVRETRTVTITQKIPYGVEYIDEADYYRGYIQQVREGSSGEREVTAQVIFEDGEPVQVLAIKVEEKAAPVSRVVRRGVKVLRSETYDGSAWQSSFIRPLKTGFLSADYHDYPGHNGIDLAAPYGTPVYAAAGGRVTLSRWYGEYGYCVMIEHADGSVTLYGHNSSLLVRVGETVKQGQLIARVGSTGNSTGNHLHFEIRAGGEYLDPLIYMDQ